MARKITKRHSKLEAIIEHLKSISVVYQVFLDIRPQAKYASCSFIIEKFEPFTIYIDISAPIRTKAGEFSKHSLYYRRYYTISWHTKDEGHIDSISRSNLPNFIAALYNYHIIYNKKDIANYD